MNLDNIVLYDIKLRKKGLKKIRRILVSKYGDRLSDKIVVSEKSFLKKVKCDNNDITYANVKNEYGVVSYNVVINPSIAVYITEIMNGNYDYIKWLMNLETYTYGTCGKEYINDIFKNIEFKMFNKSVYNQYKDSHILKKNKVITMKKPFE